MFSPYNYHDRDRSRAMTSGVKIDVSSESGADVHFYGAGEQREDVLKALSSFRGQPAPVRKYHAAIFGDSKSPCDSN